MTDTLHTTNLRSEIRQLLSTLAPIDDMEQSHIRTALEWIDSGSELFRRESPAVPDTHLVAYFALLSKEMDKILLVDHKKARLWLPPGEHVEPDEHPKETVKREIREELGVDAHFLVEEPLFLTVTQTVGTVTKHTDVSLWYVLKGDPQQTFNYDINEFNQIRWFSFDELPYSGSDPHMQRFINKIHYLEYNRKSQLYTSLLKKNVAKM